MSNPLPNTFESALTELSKAVTDTQDVKSYYSKLPQDLAQINKDLQDISADIKKIITELDQKTIQLEENSQKIEGLNMTLTENEAQKSDLLESNKKIQEERQNVLTQIQELREEQESDRATNIRKLDELQAEHGRILEAQRLATDQQKVEELAKRDDENSKKIDDLTATMKNEQDVLAGQLASLTKEKVDLDEQSKQINAELASLQSVNQGLSSNLESLTKKNTELTAQLNEATDVMNQATDILRDMPKNRSNIDTELIQLTRHITEIKRILGRGRQEPGEEEYVDATQTILPEDTKITKKYFSNNRTNEKTFSLIKLVEVIQNSDLKNKDQLIYKLMTATNKVNVDNILNELTEGQLATIMTNKTLSGGRKTKKQRGGFKYNTNARRTSITTTRRTSSRRTRSRRTSSRRSPTTSSR